MPTLRRRNLQTSLSTASKQMAPSCLQVGQPSEEQPPEEEQAADVTEVTHKAAGPGTVQDTASSGAGVADVLRAECQVARLQVEQELAALQATLQKQESNRQLRVAALQDGLPLATAGLHVSRRQLQLQVALQRRCHQEARLAELNAQHRLALAEGTMHRHKLRTGKQPPRFGAAARKIWQVLPEAIPSDPYIAHRVKLLTQGPRNPSRPGQQNGTLPKSRFRPRPAAAERPTPAGSAAPGCTASAGASQAPLPATHRLPAQPGTTSGQLAGISRAEVQQQSVSAANSTLQQEDRLRAQVKPQVYIAATSAIDHTGYCALPSRGRPPTVLATCSCAATASQEHCACPGTWQSVLHPGTALMLPAAQPPARRECSLVICLGTAM